MFVSNKKSLAVFHILAAAQMALIAGAPRAHGDDADFIDSNKVQRLACYEQKNTEILELQKDPKLTDEMLADMAKTRMGECDQRYPLPPEPTPADNQTPVVDAPVNTDADNEVVEGFDKTEDPTLKNPTIGQKAEENNTIPGIPGVPANLIARLAKQPPGDQNVKLGYVYNTKTGSSIVVAVDTGIKVKALGNRKLNISGNAHLLGTRQGHQLPKAMVRADVRDDQIWAWLQNGPVPMPYMGAQLARDKGLRQSWEATGYVENRGEIGKTARGSNTFSANGSYGLHAGFGGTDGYKFVPVMGAHGKIEGAVCEVFGSRDEHRVCIIGAVKAKLGLSELNYGGEIGAEYGYKIDKDSIAGKYLHSVEVKSGVDYEQRYDVSGSHDATEIGVKAAVRW